MAWSASSPSFYRPVPIWLTHLLLDSTRLRNIEETEKAKRQVAEERKERKKVNTDEEHLVATRCTSLLHISFCARVSYLFSHRVVQFTDRTSNKGQTRKSCVMPSWKRWGCLRKKTVNRGMTSRRWQRMNLYVALKPSWRSWYVADACPRSWNGSRNGCEDDTMDPFSLFTVLSAQANRHAISASASFRLSIPTRTLY